MSNNQEQSRNPADTSVAGTVKKSRFLAIVLAILSPELGMLYLDQARRALLYFAARIAAVLIGALAVLFGLWRYSVEWFPLLLVIEVYGIYDAYRTAGEKEISLPLSWYSRWYGICGILVILSVGLAAYRHSYATFRIPAGSMLPTLLVGDMIVVDKSSYRFDVEGAKLPARGDVIVFRYPPKPALTYVKRVIGLPGDRISYVNKRLTVNGKTVGLQEIGEYKYMESGPNLVIAKLFQETLESRTYEIILNPEAPSIHVSGVKPFEYRALCSQSDEGFNCQVPAGHYFTLGDNRDASADSRYWGFVPAQNIIGKATRIYASEGRGFTRIATQIP